MKNPYQESFHTLDTQASNTNVLPCDMFVCHLTCGSGSCFVLSPQQIHSDLGYLIRVSL